MVRGFVPDAELFAERCRILYFPYLLFSVPHLWGRVSLEIGAFDNWLCPIRAGMRTARGHIPR
jgi:hypothetical protein